MSRITINAVGDQCPIPVVKTKKAIEGMSGAGTVEISVDNEIAVQNLTKMAKQKGLAISSEKKSDKLYVAVIDVTEEAAGKKNVEEPVECAPDAKGDICVVFSSACMGTGDDELGRILMKGAVYALGQLDVLPKTILLFNGGVRLTTENPDTIKDFKGMEAQGVEILSCGTCLDFYGLKEKVQVGGITNMYTIIEKMSGAGKVVRI